MGNRSRNVYEITDKGRTALGSWASSQKQPPRIEIEALLRLLFADQGSTDDVLRALDEFETDIGDHHQAIVELMTSYLRPVVRSSNLRMRSSSPRGQGCNGRAGAPSGSVMRSLAPRHLSWARTTDRQIDIYTGQVQRFDVLPGTGSAGTAAFNPRVRRPFRKETGSRWRTHRVRSPGQARSRRGASKCRFR